MTEAVTWDGIVQAVWPDGDTFTAELRREGAPDITADFSMRECGVSVQEGDVLVVSENSVTVRDLGTWAQEELDSIRARAEALSRRLRGMDRD